MKGNLISHIKLNGHMQMELDKSLLKQSFFESNFTIVARFYSWEGNWVSIGRNQKEIPQKWHELVNQKKIGIVRRPTGGDAVLHSGGITYSIIWKEPPKTKKEAYIQASQWLINGFKDLGIPLEFGNQKPTRSSVNCFSTATQADLIDQNGSKRVGSAQLWQKGHLLQHGEILVAPSKNLWFELFKNSPPKRIPLQLTTREIENVLSKKLTSYWSELKWHRTNIDKKSLQKILP